MPLALNDDHRDLADSVAAFARRAAPVATTRAQFGQHAAGKRPEFWDTLLRNGLHAIHLPERHGGAGAGLAELAVVIEQLGHSLVPGPYLPTVIASSVLAGAPQGDLVDELLGAFGDGATGALVATDGLTAVRNGESGTDWTVEGVSAPVLGLPGAEVVLVRASVEEADGSDGDPVWFRLGAGATATVHTDEGTDLTRSVGCLQLTGHRVTAADLLPAPDHVELTVNGLLAAEASGIARWCVETAVDYVRTREQFGKPVGSFQAVQHKAALMLVDAEIACAAAWDAARAAEQGTEQRRLAAAQAALTALPRGIDTALACVTLLGGIGFTWEHDVHLYWRRAISIASVVGTEEQSATRLGEAALVSERDFSFVDESDFTDLRARVGSVLDEVCTLPDDAVVSTGWAPARGGARRARLAEAGLVAPHYPVPYGLGAGPAEQAAIGQEFARRGLDQPSTVIGEWVLPTILVHGSEAQKERFVEPTLRGEIVWCQLFSEPGAGSDLAGLSTKARKVDGGWSLSGQKVWNSMAHEADWGVCLARTDPDAAKHRGISYFLVDMRTPGVDVRPLRQSTGRSEFNEVFLDDVFVPDDCLVAEPGHGWKLAVTTLSNERLSMGNQLSHGSTHLLKSLIADGRQSGSRAEAVRVLGRNTGREMALAALNLRSVLGRLSGLDVGAEISVQKVFNAIAQRDGSRTMLGLLGPRGCVSGPVDAEPTNLVVDHIGLPAVLFGGGTIEIQLNVIAQRVLGLPR